MEWDVMRPILNFSTLKMDDAYLQYTMCKNAIARNDCDTNRNPISNLPQHHQTYSIAEKKINSNNSRFMSIENVPLLCRRAIDATHISIQF